MCATKTACSMFFRQLYALLWKNYILKSRNWITTLLEVFLPVLVVLILWLIRANISINNADATDHVNEICRINPATINCNAYFYNTLSNQPLFPGVWNKGGQDRRIIAFAPNNPFVQGFVNKFYSTYQGAFDTYSHTVDLTHRLRIFNSQDEINNYVTDAGYGIEMNDGIDRNYSIAALVFNQMYDPSQASTPPKWSYTIVLNSTNGGDQSTINTNQVKLVNTIHTVYDNTYEYMFESTGQMFLQNFVENYILQNTTGADVSTRSWIQVPFPTPAYVTDIFAVIVGFLLGFFFTLVYIWPITRLIKALVEEKESRIKEGMKMMGLSESVLWLSWMLTYALLFLITSIFISLIISGQVFTHSDRARIFFLFFMFSLVIISYCYLVSSFSSRATVASTIGAVVFFISFFPYFAVNDGTSSSGSKMLASLSPSIALALGSVVIANYEAAETGINSANSGVDIDNFSYDRCIGMLVLDFILYTLLSLYFSRVVKQEWGTSEPWYFPCLPSFWCPKKITVDPDRAPTSIDGVSPIELKEHASGPIENENIEPVSESIRKHLGVAIRNLRKEFILDSEEEPQVAVKSLNLDLYKGQILALLGHNGAGKTTTINMLSGMMSATSGDASVFGLSVRDQMSSIRNVLGVCPQHNILFNELTVYEHLKLFCLIKGVPSDEIDQKVTEMIEQVGLTEKVNYQSGGLSGGMQRKLSVGIALIGDSRIIFLDEPTSGMDPYSRRATWDLLKKKKDEVDENGNPLRVFILTTHFMDEADQLGDRIAIMAKGEIKCCGSPLFLKNRYGVGYTMTISKRPTFDNGTVSRLVSEVIPSSEVLSNVAAEITFRLPIKSSSHFADLFDTFDQRQDTLGIDSYGVSVTTLEEVFLRVGRDEPLTIMERQASKRDIEDRKKSMSAKRLSQTNKYAINSDNNNNNKDELTQVVTDNLNPTEAAIVKAKSVEEDEMNDKMNVLGSLGHGPVDPFATFARHFRALLIKRYHNAKRDRRVLLWTLIYPIAIMFCVGLQLLIKTTRPAVSINYAMLNTPTPIPFTPNAANLFSHSMVPGPAAISPFVISQASLNNYTQSQYFSLMQSLGFVGLNNTINAPPQVQNILWQAGSVSNYLLNTFLNKRDPDNTNDPGLRLSRYVAFATAGGPLTPCISKTCATDPTSAPSPNSTGTPTTIGPTTGPSGIPNYSGLYLTDRPILFWNTSAVFGLPLALNTYNQFVLQTLTNNPSATIESNSESFPNTAQQKTLVNTTITALIICIAFAFIPASFADYAVKEEEVKIRHQQFISGVSVTAYWLSSFVWDFLNFLLPAFSAMIIFSIYGIDQLIGSNSGATILGILLFGLSVIPFSYMCSFLFSNSTTARTVMLISFIFFGALLNLTSYFLSLISSTHEINKSLKFIYRLFPMFCFGEVINNEMSRSSQNLWDTPRSLWDIDITGYPMIFMFWESIVFFAVVLLIEQIRSTPALLSYFTRGDAPHREFKDEDPDVVKEKQRLYDAPVPDMDKNREIISIRGLRKVYPSRLGLAPKIAVHDLWLGIPEGQCYGYLGINGAGKTTTLKMLTADIIPTGGTAYLNGFDIRTHQNSIRRLLGYCPQFDALISSLTAREHLYLFARIKGVEEAKIPMYVDLLIKKIGLQEGQADKPCGGYSGGNKRKLCVGIALIGNPPIVFLDEPSTGMDPGSRRFMWDLIASTMANRSVILTTHSMEECEALCQQIGIMVGGRLRCSGSSQRLKAVYGSGYQVDVHVRGVNKGVDFANFLEQNFTGAQILEKHGEYLKYRIPKINDKDGSKVSIGQMFRTIEGAKKDFDISDYSVSETTLEQIFIYFAKQQEEETGQAGFE